MRAKSELLARDHYSLTVAAVRIAKMLADTARGRAAPNVIRIERGPVEGWDDVVEENDEGARHYQVKRQLTDFDAEELRQLLVVLRDNPTIQGTLFVHSLVDVKDVGPLRGYISIHRRSRGLYATEDLEVAAAGFYASTEAPWLKFLRDIVGDSVGDAGALRLAARFKVEQGGELEDMAERGAMYLDHLCDDGAGAFSVLQTCVAENSDEAFGWRPTETLSMLRDRADRLGWKPDPIEESRSWLRQPTPPVSPRDMFDRLAYAAQDPPFVGRKPELEQLRRFLDTERPITWWAITGAGGIGKSRLVFEFLEYASVQEAWVAGWLRSGHVAALSTPDAPLLVLVDYLAETEDLRAHDLVQLLTTLRDGAERSGHKCRVVILERNATDLCRSIRRVPNGGSEAWGLRHDEPMELCRLEGADKQELADALGADESALSGNPLEDVLRASVGTDTRATAAQFILDKEQNRWGEARGEITELVALASAVGGLPGASALPRRVRNWVAARYDESAVKRAVSVDENGQVSALKHDLLGELLVLNAIDPLDALKGDPFTLPDLDELAVLVNAGAWRGFLHRCASDFPAHPRWNDLAALCESPPGALSAAIAAGALAQDNAIVARGVLRRLEQLADQDAEYLPSLELAGALCLIRAAPGMGAVLNFDAATTKIHLSVSTARPAGPGDTHPLEPGVLWALSRDDLDAFAFSPLLTKFARAAVLHALEGKDTARTLELAEQGLRLLKESGAQSAVAVRPVAWIVSALAVGAYQFNLPQLDVQRVARLVDVLHSLAVDECDRETGVMLGESSAALVLLATTPPFYPDLLSPHRDRVLELHSRWPDDLDPAVGRVAVNGARGISRMENADEAREKALKVIELVVGRAEASGSPEQLELATSALRELFQQNDLSLATESQLSRCWDLAVRLGRAQTGYGPEHAATNVFSTRAKVAMGTGAMADVAARLRELATFSETWSDVVGHAIHGFVKTLASSPPDDGDVVILLEELPRALKPFYERNPPVFGMLAGELFGWAQRRRGSEVAAALIGVFREFSDFPGIGSLHDALTRN